MMTLRNPQPDRRRITPERIVTLSSIATICIGAVFGSFHIIQSVETRVHAESTYVAKGTFEAFKQGAMQQRSLDSSAHAFEQFENRQVIYSLDSSDKCRRHIERYCR